MWSMKEMFYAEQEPVWIVKPEKKDGDKKGEGGSSGGGGGGGGGGKGKSEYTILDAIPYYPYYYPDYVAPTAGKGGGGDKKESSKTLVMKVPLCCGECEESVQATLGQMKGVKSVDCNIRREKVTVVVTTAAPADVLLALRDVFIFRNARMWSDDD